MALNRLHTYNWEQGTSENPVSLNSDEMNNLVALALSGSVNSDVKGYVHPTSSITSYQLCVLGENYPNLHLVDATVVDADYSVLFENNLTTAAINEGNQIGIIPLNIGLEGLKFRIYSHTITTDNIATEETIRGRIHVESGRVVVDAARENSSWSDTVIIQALPVYQEWDDGVHQPKELTLNVSAIKVTSVAISAPAMARPGSVVNGTIVLSYHTKPIVTSAQNDGSGIFVAPKFGDSLVGKGSDGISFSFIAPSEEDDYTITCALYAFNTTTIALTATPVTLHVMQPYIQFTVTTDGTFSDISSANPKITLQKVDSQDEPIGEPIVLTGAVSSSSLVYTYGNGNVAGDGSETYKVSIDKISMHSAHYTDTIVPNGVISNYTINYGVIEAEIGIIYDDGTKQSKEEYYTTMSFIANKTVVGVYIETDDTKFIVDTENANNTTLYGLGGYNQTISELPSFTIEEALLDFNGKLRTNQMAMGSAGIVAAMRTMQQITSTINGTSRKAFYAAGGQAKLIAINFSFIKNIAKLRSYTNVADNSVNYYTSPNRIDSSTMFFNAKKNESISIQNGVAFPCFGLEYDVNYDVII